MRKTVEKEIKAEQKILEEMKVKQEKHITEEKASVKSLNEEKNKSQEKTAIERKVTSDGPNCNYPKEFANNMQRQLRPITTLNKSEVEDRCENIRKQSESKPLVTLSYKPTSKPPLPTSKKSPNPKTW